MDPIQVDFRYKTAKATFSVGYDVCFNAVDKTICLPGFHAPDDANVRWLFDIAPETSHFEPPGFRFLKIYLRFESSVHQKLLVRPTVKVSQTSSNFIDDCVKQHGGKGVTQNSFRVNLNTVCSLHSPSESWNLREKLAFFNDANNRLIIDANILYCRDENEYDVKGLSEEPDITVVGGKCVLDGLGALLASGELADAALIVDGEELPAHRAILSAQSDVFKAMFMTACSEKDTGRVIIQDVRVAVVKQLLRFLYTGSVDADLKFLPELLIVADKYMVAALRELCQRRLEKVLGEDLHPAAPEESSAAVLCGVLKVSALLGSAPLRQVALDFLKRHMEAVVRTPAWAKLAVEQRELAGAAMVDAMTPPAPPAGGRLGQEALKQKKRRKRR